MKALLKNTPEQIFCRLKGLGANSSIEAAASFDVALERLSYKITAHNYARAMRILDKIIKNTGGHKGSTRKYVEL